MDRKELQNGINRLLESMPEGVTSGGFSWEKNGRAFHISFTQNSDGGSGQIYLGDHEIPKLINNLGLTPTTQASTSDAAPLTTAGV